MEMIVISANGQAGWKRFVFGAVAERVIRETACPVLAIPAPDGEQSRSVE
jgi:nucleotide-binding universal stress UspA family protein